MCNEAIVYLINDDAAAYDALILSLVHGGFKVEAYTSGPSFLQAYNGYHPACLIMDLCMLEMDGLAVRQELIQRNMHIPIIFMTGYGMIRDSLSAIKTGAVYFLEKPFARATLFERIREALYQECRGFLFHEAQPATKTLREDDISMHDEWFTLPEWECMALVTAGKSRRQIAAALEMSVRTVDTHLIRLMEKLQTSSLAELSEIFMQPHAFPEAWLKTTNT